MCFGSGLEIWILLSLHLEAASIVSESPAVSTSRALHIFIEMESSHPDSSYGNG
jgi:hypothetical protein